jgi:hypothetical protein
MNASDLTKGDDMKSRRSFLGRLAAGAGVASGGWWGRTPTGQINRGVIAVAVKYR